ncbi:MAG: hypothetical protein WA082_04575 [Candidatus Moraniibacteriota bacterium]
MKPLTKEESEVIVLGILRRHTGVDNAINDKMIRDLVTVADPDKRKFGAGLRDVVNSLRQQGEPICSGLVGYWYAADIDELEQNINALDGRALKIMSATKGMRETLNVWKHNHQERLL